MCRNLALAATAFSLFAALPAFAADAPATAKPVAGPAPSAPAAAPAPPRKATAEERAMAERLDPLARAAFWGREVQVDPRDVDAQVRLAASLRVLERFDEAADTAQQALVVDPTSKPALYEAARDYIAGGRGFYAIELLKRTGGADWQSLSLLGVAYEQSERPQEAEAAWRQALTLSPNNPAVLSNLAMHFAARGDSAQAETLLRQAAAQPGASIQVRQNLALVLGLQGKFAEAEQIARQDLPPEIANNNLAYLHAATGADSRSWKSLQGAQAASN